VAAAAFEYQLWVATLLQNCNVNGTYLVLVAKGAWHWPKRYATSLKVGG
jgi:hypothetical protein